jgi:hypothetical protein
MCFFPFAQEMDAQHPKVRLCLIAYEREQKGSFERKGIGSPATLVFIQDTSPERGNHAFPSSNFRLKNRVQMSKSPKVQLYFILFCVVRRERNDPKEAKESGEKE